MQSPESRAPTPRAEPTCGKGCTEICDQCSGFELEADWETGLTQPVVPPASSKGATIAPPERHAQDPAWLEGRLADIAAKLEQTVKSYDPAPALDKFSVRLDNFEARVEAVIDRAVAGHDPESLRFIEARVREIDDQFDKMRNQLGRISTIDARVAEIWDHVQLDLPSPTAGLPKLVEGAVSRALAAATVLKAEGAAAESPEVAAFERMEEALNRLIERVEAIEIQAVTPDRQLDDPNDDIELINRAYEEGARALGLIMTEAPSDPVHTLRALHAADYVPRFDEEMRERAPEIETAPAPAPAQAPEMPRPAAESPVAKITVPVAPVTPSEPVDSAEGLRESFRASALRAKQRAQAEAEMYARALPPPERFTVSGPAMPTPPPVFPTGFENRPVSSLFPPPPADAAKPVQKPVHLAPIGDKTASAKPVEEPERAR